MRAAAILMALSLAACGPATPPPETTAPAPHSGFTLGCAAFAALTPDTLAQRFGAENITTQTFETEGEPYEATVVFDNDPSRRLVIVWNDAKTSLASVSVSDVGTQWRASEGYSVGTPIADVERINVMPFKLWGFGWDYGGRVSDWSAGVLGQDPVCRNSVGFSPRSDGSAMGDSEFSSNDAAVRAADPIVSEFGLMIAAPTAGQ